MIRNFKILKGLDFLNNFILLYLKYKINLKLDDVDKDFDFDVIYNI